MSKLNIKNEKIAIAQFRARNIKENSITKIFVELVNGFYYYIAFNGQRSTKYRDLDEAKNNIKELWGSWYDFKLLV